MNNLCKYGNKTEYITQHKALTFGDSKVQLLNIKLNIKHFSEFLPNCTDLDLARAHHTKKGPGGRVTGAAFSSCIEKNEHVSNKSSERGVRNI